MSTTYLALPMTLIDHDWRIIFATSTSLPNMSRFLVRLCTSCKNLASHLLGWAIRRFPKDFEARYSFSPLLLESFVDTALHMGTCYRAANWQRVGCTKGRGRQGQLSDEPETVKDIRGGQIVRVCNALPLSSPSSDRGSQAKRQTPKKQTRGKSQSLCRLFASERFRRHQTRYLWSAFY